MAKLSEILRERGYVYQHSSETLGEITDGAKRTVYLGIDPSADSLHVGHLQAMLVLRRFLEDGHRVILLIGGGTGMIGDPSGKSEERNLLDEATVEHNTAAIRVQAEYLFGGLDFKIVDNADWLGSIDLIGFLRDIGKHFSISAMLQRDSVKNRLLKQEEGISYTEFSYMLLQAYDFLHLHREYGCDLQIGASDQWGNMVSGIDLIRRKTGETAYALSFPLLINKSTGKKFGKSESGAVWLDSTKTPFFNFYQFWLNSEDDALEEYLLKMTTMNKEEISEVLNVHDENRGVRYGQHRLAKEVTTLVHGTKASDRAEFVSRVLFGKDGSVQRMTDADWALLIEDIPSTIVTVGESLTDALISSELATSKREARQFIIGGAITLNYKSEKVDRPLDAIDFMNGHALLQRGKRAVAVLVRS